MGLRDASHRSAPPYKFVTPSHAVSNPPVIRSNSRMLVSPNRSDFAAPNATVFHPEIVPDAAAAWLRYAISLDAALADLRASGEIL